MRAVLRRLVLSRQLHVVALYAALAVAANAAAFLLRFDGIIPPADVAVGLALLPWLVVLRLTAFVWFGVVATQWRHVDMWDLRNIILASAASTVAFWALVTWVFGITRYPRSIFLVDALLLIMLVGGTQLVTKLHATAGRADHGKRVLVYGAGDAAASIAREMKNNPGWQRVPIGFVDEKADTVGQRIHGTKVLGGPSDLVGIVARERPDEILVALGSKDAATFRRVVTALETFRIPIKTLPSLGDLLDGRVAMEQIRDISMDDLLPRPSTTVDAAPIDRFVRGKRVLVTGAAGSIGSELCRQLASAGPGALILLDKAESPLYDLDGELQRRHPHLECAAVLADIKAGPALDRVFAMHRPDVVFHAAAYKHVPLMETHPEEAVLNNVVGTRGLLEVATRRGAGHFVLISTDKAVYPTSVMGASKRLAELYVQAVSGRLRYHDTRCSIVRFGNVLGSNGSVVPLFMRQIEQGGPVTVTHPEVARYFMTVHEAVHLVLRAAVMARGGDTFVLEMGEQVRIADLARDLVRVSGRVPGEDIAIVFTGLRPGEKLREELVTADEVIEGSDVAAIRRVRSRVTLDLGALESGIDELQQLALRGDREQLTTVLARMTEAMLTPTAGYTRGRDHADPSPGLADEGSGVTRAGKHVLFVDWDTPARCHHTERLFLELQGGELRHRASSATVDGPGSRVTTRDLAWADVVIALDPRCVDFVGRHWPSHAHKSTVYTFPDGALRRDTQARSALVRHMDALLDDLDHERAVAQCLDAREVNGT
jgi:FlaA1/EpsC-like NDP-sugar epimerase